MADISFGFFNGSDSGEHVVDSCHWEHKTEQGLLSFLRSRGCHLVTFTIRYPIHHGQHWNNGLTYSFQFPFCFQFPRKKSFQFGEAMALVLGFSFTQKGSFAFFFDSCQAESNVPHWPKSQGEGCALLLTIEVFVLTVRLLYGGGTVSKKTKSKFQPGGTVS